MRNLYPYIFLLLLISCKGGKVSKNVTSKEDKNKIPQCVDLFFDLSDGAISGVKPVLKQSEIREWFPCYTKVVPDGSMEECGGGLYYKNHGFTYYTYLYKYLEVTKDFKGRVTHDLFQKTREEVRELLGQPLQNDLSIDNPDMDFFSMEYGCIRIKYENNMPVLIASYYLGCDEIDWCR